MHKFLLALLFVLALGRAVRAQPGETSRQDSTCIHVNINRINASRLVKFTNPALCLDYYDPYGIKDTLKLSFYDWKHNLVSRPVLSKSFGKNSYSINLEELNMEAGKETYTLELHNDMGKKHVLYFKLLPPPDKPDPIVDIFVNPIQLHCEEQAGNLIEFYGMIDGGKAPYVVNWIITNESKSSLLYQPRQVIIERAGNTPSIQVDQSPSYAVMLHVTDACGNEGQQVVNIQCKPDMEKSNNLFIELLPDSPSPAGTGLTR